MHEVSLMQQTLGIALEHASRHDAQRIHKVAMRIGPLSGVVPEALAFAFDVVTRGTIAEGATFDLEPVPLVRYCPSCRLDFEPPDLGFDCPRCRQPSAVLRQGRELELAFLEVS